MSFEHEINARDFAIVGGRLEITLKCWRLQRNAGDLATMSFFTQC